MDTTLTPQTQSFAAKTSEDQFNLSFICVESSEGVFFVPKYAAHRPASQAILNGRLYEPYTHIVIAEILRLRPGSLVHAGTFFGDMLPSFSKAASELVYAFEPVLENYLLAKLCVQENNLGNVLIQNAGLSSSITVARINTAAGNGDHLGGASHISDSGQSTTLLTIDSLAISNLSIIQLDVEGHELEALKGAIQTIKTHWPVIMIEDNHNNCAEFLTGC